MAMDWIDRKVFLAAVSAHRHRRLAAGIPTRRDFNLASGYCAEIFDRFFVIQLTLCGDEPTYGQTVEQVKARHRKERAIELIWDRTSRPDIASEACAGAHPATNQANRSLHGRGEPVHLSRLNGPPLLGRPFR